MKTTLNEIKAAGACEGRYAHLLKALGKIKADDEPLSIREILKHNGIDDAVWALRVVDGHDREIRLFACDCAEMVLPIFEEQYPDDDRPRKAIETSRKYANGEATAEELTAATDATGAAAGAAAWADIKTILLKYIDHTRAKPRKTKQMKRPIKFRRVFKNEKTGEITFHYWGVIDHKGKATDITRAFTSPGTNSHAIAIADNQFTGLHDKNGVEIYEDDVCDLYDLVASPFDGNYDGRYVVEFLLPDCAFNLVQLDEQCSVRFHETFIIEVIGNIHENPELL